MRNQEFQFNPHDYRDENLEDAIDAMIETVIQANGQRVNEGNNGVILHINAEVVDAEQRHLLEQHGIPLEGEHAMKALKIFTPDAARREFQLQDQAYQVTETAARAGNVNLAKVPRPALGRDVTIHKETREALDQQHVRISGDEIGILLMEYVPGQDLATILYREALLRHPEANYLRPEEIKEMDFNELQDNVWRVFGFAKPGGKSRDSGDRQFEEEKVATLNAEKIYTFLRRNGFRLHPSITEKIQNTIDLFHDNGLVHRDGHPRNFMVVGNYEAPSRNQPDETPEVYIVDYGIAQTFPAGKYNELKKDLYLEESLGVTKRCPPDETIIRQLKRLAQTSEQFQNDEDIQLYHELGDIVKRSENSEAFQKARKAAEEDPTSLSHFIKSFTLSPQKSIEFPALLYRLHEEGTVNSNEAREVIEAHINTFPVQARTLLTRLYKSLGSK